ncbi:protein PARALOG OF AIPP2-like isoform X1 [Musa acuminata AAA Group]|uniref:protein PARALOG OF AIPP2-like isoform X1 n=2 Tax=Musa acuminata AAA Group TaxID=214697 RepID=UPI0031DB7E1F
MRNRRERALTELYDATERLSRPEITPILQGTCRIQGPVDECDYGPQRTDSGNFLLETKCLNILEDHHTRAEPGTCNVCSALCSSCLHFNRLSPPMESKIEGGPSGISSRKEDDSCSYIATSSHVVKSRVYDKQKSACSETSHLLSSSSSHDSSIENSEIKETFRESVEHDASENVVISSKVTLDTVEDNNYLQEQTSSTPGSPFSSNGSKPADLQQGKTSDITEEKHRRQCPLENDSHVYKDANSAIHSHLGESYDKVISRSTDGLLVKNDEKEIQKEAADDCNNSEVEEDKRSEGNGNYSVKISATCSLRDDILCQKADGIEDPHSSSNTSLKAQLTDSDSLKKGSLTQCSIDDEKFPINRKLVAGNVDVRKDIAHGTSKEDNGESQPQLVSSTADVFLGTEKGDNSRFQPHEEIKGITDVEQPDKPKPTSPISWQPLQPNSECEISAEIEDDVKVCDICGDSGQEELLAICSRCSDGAEHTYCMRIMLDKVPEGEWLCEECQLKEDENQMIGKSEAQFEAVEAPCLDTDRQNIESTSKSLPCVENKAVDPDIKIDNKELGSSISSKMKGENSEATSVTKEKIFEACSPSTGTSIPSKPNLLSHENSFSKPDFVQVKPSALITSCSQSEGISRPVAHSKTSSDPDASKPHAHIEPPRGPLSKSVSFNNLKVPKVKQLLVSIPQNKKMIKESNSSSSRKGPSQTITKSASFRNESSIVPSVKTMSKSQSLNSPQPDNPRGVQQAKERSVVDKKTSTANCRFVNPSVSATSVFSPKINSKVQQYDDKLKRASDSSNTGNNRVSIDATSSANEVKQQPSSCLSRASGRTSSMRLCKNEDQKLFQLVPKPAELTHRDDKTKDHTSLSNSRQGASVGDRLQHFQRCKETDHSAQFCAVDKLRMSAVKPSSEQSLRDMDNRSIKSKDAVEVLSWKFGTKRSVRSPDQSEEVSLSGTDVNSESTSSDFTSNFLSSGNLPMVEGAADVHNFSKATNSIHMKQKMDDHKKTIICSREGASLDAADDLNMKPIIQILLDQASFPTHPLKASVIPELEYIWQGAFEVLRTAKPPALFDGIQAHLSAYVSPKALEVATHFPCKVQLEEVPRLNSWPLQFYENSPKEENIALFFFAKDTESYDKYYWKLLENMLKNDLALIGNIDAVELLIFPSNVLPENSQRWNKLFYLWGVFRGRNKRSFTNLPDLEKKPSISNLNLEPTVRDLPTPAVSGLCSSIDISDENSQKLSRSDRSPKAKSSKFGNCIDLQNIPTSGDENEVLNSEQPLVQKAFHQAIADDKVLTEQASCSLPASCSLKNISQLPSVTIAYPEPNPQIPCAPLAYPELKPNINSGPVGYSEPKLQIDIERLPIEMENEPTSLDKLANDLDSKNDSEHHVHASGTKISNCEDPAYLFSLNCCQGNETDLQRIKQKENFITSEVVLYSQRSENVVQVDSLSWESKPNRKRAQPSSVEMIRNSAGHMLKPTADAMQWKDEASCTSLSAEQHKKTRLDNGGHAACRLKEETLSSKLSSKIQPLPSGLINDSVYHENVSESLRNAERYFPIDLSRATSAKEDKLIYVLSSDDEDSPESSAPDLELALGGNRGPIKQDTLPLLSTQVVQGNLDKMPATAADDGDGSTALLSLSLAFPSSDRAQTAKPISQTQQLLPDKPCINTSLLLFGGYTDSEHI